MEAKILPIGTTVFRQYDEKVYRKTSPTYDVKSVSYWESDTGHKIIVSDLSIQTNEKQFRNLTLP